MTAPTTFPVGPEGEALVAQHRALAGTVEGDAGVTAPDGRGPRHEVGHFQDRVADPW